MSTFRKAFLPVIWSYRFIGLTLIQIPENVSWPKSTVAYITTLTLTYSYILWRRLNMAPDTADMVPLVILIFHVILIFNVIAAVGSAAWFWLHREINLDFIRRITLVDETIESLGIDYQYKQERKEILKKVLLLLMATIVLLASAIAVYYNICNTIAEVLIQTIAFFWPQVINMFVELIFTIKLSVLQKRFENVNALIYNVIINSSQTESYQTIEKYQRILINSHYYDAAISNFYEKSRNDLEYLLATTRQLHLDLSSISGTMNYTNGVQIAMQIAVKFAFLIGYSYSFYLLYKEEEMLPEIKISFCVFVVIRVVYDAIRFYIIIQASENVTAEALKTSQMAQEIEDPQQNIIDEIHQYSLQIMQDPLKFTACGLHALDFNFVQSFVGSVLFYLIILIQNQSAIKKTADAIIADDGTNSSTVASTISFM